MRLLLLGDGEVCDHLAELAGWLNYAEVQRGDEVPSSIDGNDHVVIASRSPARARSLLARVLTVGAPAYVGLVASDQEAHAALLKLSADRIPSERIERVSAPAGHTLAAVATTDKETAIAIAADLLAARRGAARG